MTEQAVLAIIALCVTAVGGLVWALKAQMRQGAGRELAWRELMTNDQVHHRADMEKISEYMGEQTAVLREVRDDLRELRR